MANYIAFMKDVALVVKSTAYAMTMPESSRDSLLDQVCLLFVTDQKRFLELSDPTAARLISYGGQTDGEMRVGRLSE
jgi:hypothetical protein